LLPSKATKAVTTGDEPVVVLSSIAAPPALRNAQYEAARRQNACQTKPRTAEAGRRRCPCPPRSETWREYCPPRRRAKATARSPTVCSQGCRSSSRPRAAVSVNPPTWRQRTGEKIRGNETRKGRKTSGLFRRATPPCRPCLESEIPMDTYECAGRRGGRLRILTREGRVRFPTSVGSGLALVDDDDDDDDDDYSTPSWGAPPITTTIVAIVAIVVAIVAIVVAIVTSPHRTPRRGGPDHTRVPRGRVSVSSRSRLCPGPCVQCRHSHQ